MFVRSNEKKINYFYVYVYLLIITKIKNKNKIKYIELEIKELEFHKRKKKKSITLEFCIYKELEFDKLKYFVAWNSSLIRSSSMWYFFNKKFMLAQVFL